MGKWSKLKDKFTRFVQEPEFQQKVDAEKAVLTTRGFSPLLWEDNVPVLEAVLESLVNQETNPEDLVATPGRMDWCKALATARRIKDLNEAIEKVMNLRLEACNQLLVDNLEGEDESKVINILGTFSIKDAPYPTVKDKPSFLKWVRDTDQEEILSVNYNTMSAIVKAKIEKGEELPPGVEVFMKTSILWTKSRE